MAGEAKGESFRDISNREHPALYAAQGLSEPHDDVRAIMSRHGLTVDSPTGYTSEETDQGLSCRVVANGVYCDMGRESGHTTLVVHTQNPYVMFWPGHGSAQFVFHAGQVIPESIIVDDNQESALIAGCPKGFRAMTAGENMISMQFKLIPNAWPHILNEEDNSVQDLQNPTLADEKLEHAYTAMQGGTTITIFRKFLTKTMPIATERSILWMMSMRAAHKYGSFWWAQIVASHAVVNKHSRSVTGSLFDGLRQRADFDQIMFTPYLVETNRRGDGLDKHYPATCRSFPTVTSHESVDSFLRCLELGAMRDRADDYNKLTGVFGPPENPRVHVAQFIGHELEPGNIMCYQWGVKFDTRNFGGHGEAINELGKVRPPTGSKVELIVDMSVFWKHMDREKVATTLHFDCTVVESSGDIFSVELVGRVPHSRNKALATVWEHLQLFEIGPVTMKVKVETGASDLNLDAIYKLRQIESKDVTRVDLLKLLLDGSSNKSHCVELMQNFDQDEINAFINTTIEKHRLDEDQRSAVEWSLSNHGLSLIQGPPGTGKSKVLVSIIEILLQTKMNILVVAPSNGAADNMIMHLDTADLGHLVIRNLPAHLHRTIWNALQNGVRSGSAGLNQMVHKLLAEEVLKGRRGFQSMSKFLWAPRVFRFIIKVLERDLGPNPSAAHIMERNLVTAYEHATLEVDKIYGSRDCKTPFDPDHMLDTLRTRQDAAGLAIQEYMCANGYARVVVATPHGAAESFFAQNAAFVVLIWDEMAFTTVDSVVTVLANFGKSIRTVIMAGDQHQLEPFNTSKHKNECFDQQRASLFTQCLENSASDAVMLTTEYRMVPEIARWPNQMFYAGQLKSHAAILGENEYKKLVLAVLNQKWGLNVQSARFALVTDKKNALSELPANSTSQCNRGEALLVRAFVAEVLAGFSDTGFSAREEDIAVLTPYTSQETLLRSALAEFPNVRVSSFTKFHGQEAEIVVLSMTHNPALNNKRRAADGTSLRFAAEAHALNVAVTRARNVLVLFGAITKWKMMIAVAKNDGNKGKKNMVIKAFEAMDELLKDILTQRHFVGSDGKELTNKTDHYIVPERVLDAALAHALHMRPPWDMRISSPTKAISIRSNIDTPESMLANARTTNEQSQSDAMNTDDPASTLARHSAAFPDTDMI